MAKRRPLTKEEKASAARANALWQAKKRNEKISQADAADALGISTSGFNQYINGIIPLNTDTTAALAVYFGVHPREIDPGWLHSTSPAPDTMEIEFVELLKIASPQQREKAIQEFASRLSPETALRFAKIFLARVEAGL